MEENRLQMGDQEREDENRPYKPPPDFDPGEIELEKIVKTEIPQIERRWP